MTNKTIKNKAIQAVKAITFPAAMAAYFYVIGVSVVGHADGVASTVTAGDWSAAMIGLVIAFSIEGAFTVASKLYHIFK